MPSHAARAVFTGALTISILTACSHQGEARIEAESHTDADPAAVATTTPPPEIQAWMDRLTVEHTYDPETGFIVAKRAIDLPPLLTDGPSLDQAIAKADGRVVIAFATADRCAPCQQYKKDALNDPRVIEQLGDDRLIATHVEVDREPDLADAYLGSRAIPMTYALRDGERIALLRGQRSAEDLLAWLEDVLEEIPKETLAG